MCYSVYVYEHIYMPLGGNITMAHAVGFFLLPPDRSHENDLVNSRYNLVMKSLSVAFIGD